MSRPKLPSQLHPDYPRKVLTTNDPVNTYKYPSWEAYKAFYEAHPEFNNEGEYLLLCPYCGNGVEESGPNAACCGEYARGEWTLVDEDGNIKGDL